MSNLHSAEMIEGPFCFHKDCNNDKVSLWPVFVGTIVCWQNIIVHKVNSRVTIAAGAVRNDAFQVACTEHDDIVNFRNLFIVVWMNRFQTCIAILM